MKGPHEVQQVEVGRTSPMYPYMLQAGQVESSCKVSGILENIRLNMNQLFALVTKKNYSYSRRSIFNRSGTFPLFSTWRAVSSRSGVFILDIFKKVQ